jgi:xanthine dehydrogenase YagR molybdenum-binding subunit
MAMPAPSPRAAAGRAEVVGRSFPRVEASPKVTGSARYSADVRLPGQLYAAIVRSRAPHARITQVDGPAAMAVPGVVAVITGPDTRHITWYEERAPLFAEEARFVGDEVAAVAATTRQAARDGVAACTVHAEPLAHIVDFEAADTSATVIAHGSTNQAGETKQDGRGDVEGALSRAPVVIEATYRTPTAVHNAFEPHGCVASWEGDDLTLWVSTQGVNDVRRLMAEALGIGLNRLRVIAEHVGGGFGAKQVPWKDVAIAALLSRRTGRPVQLMLDRTAENLAVGKRGATRHIVRLAAAQDGRLLAIDADLLGDRGAYRTAGEAASLWGPYLSLYRCDNVRTRTRFVYTNTGPTVAFRAPGYVEATFALESAMDELARRLELDPIELRLRNHAEIDQRSGRPWSSPQALRAAYRAVAQRSGWAQGSVAASPTTAPEPSTAAPAPRDGAAGGLPSHVRRGRGFAAHDWAAGTAMPPGMADIDLNDDGTVDVRTSVQDIGTGTRTMLAQVAAEALGVAPQQVHVVLGDSSAGPVGPTSAGSTTTPTMAPAVHAAAVDARRQLLDAAAHQLGVDPADLTLAEGKVQPTGDGGRGPITVAEVLEALGPRGVHGRGALVDAADDVNPHTFGAAVADVEVDTRTGEVRVTRVVVAPDCGRIINPLLVRSQIIGGVTQGIGFALTEAQLVDPALGIVVNPTLEDYLVPTVLDTGPIEHAPVDIPDPGANELGVKGIGELPHIPVPAAIANAVFDAIGIRFRELPITRRRVLDALAGATDQAS